MDWNNYIGGKNTIFEYIRNGKGTKVGVLLATIYNDKVCFGWSLCDKKDNFNPAFGIELAAERALSNDRYTKYFEFSDYLPDSGVEFITEILPTTVVINLPKFLNRVVRYYKNDNLSDTMDYLLASFGM